MAINKGKISRFKASVKKKTREELFNLTPAEKAKKTKEVNFAKYKRDQKKFLWLTIRKVKY